MKKAALTALLAVVSFSLFGFCPIVTTLSNGAIPCASGLSSTPAEVQAYLWIQGKADWATNGTAQVSPGFCTAGGTTGGCDSDGVDIMDETCLFDGTSIMGPWDLCASGNPGEYYLFTDWSSLNYDGCPSNDSSERAILLIYDNTGKYVLQSRSQGKDWDNWDEIGTSAATNLNISFDAIEWSGDEDANQADLYFTVIPDSMKQGAYSSGDAPTTAPVTGFRLYFYEGPSYPTNFSTSAWTAGDSFSSSTTTALNYAFPTGYDCLYISRALIVDGKELPFVSTAYIPVIPMAHPETPDDLDPCACSGVVVWNESDCWEYDGTRWHVDALMDGTVLYEDACGDGWVFNPECNVNHTIQFRKRSLSGDLVSCWSESRTFMDLNATPVPPVITAIVDNDPNAQTGVKIYYTPGYPADWHSLYRDGSRIEYDYISGTTVTADCNVSHSYEVVARNYIYYTDDSPCQYIYSDQFTAADECVGEPPEIASGLTPDDAQVWSGDKTTLSWPSYTGATGYRLYRGAQADLANLPGGAVDNSCLRYDGASTSIDLSGDTPTSWSLFWYLVTAYNGSGEGPAGTGRIINSSGGCP
ncbi:MAG TPA: hypothetical protein PLA03_13890 [Acidobacteriota bacterium]|nr:hypothetical protein [Acidobacteriota bacterium]